jgi:radical SAM superfamily enzyme YgiQ (UPF0313 family)
MRILLISPNREMLPDPVFPLGLAYLSAALSDSTHEHQVLDLCFLDDFEVAIGQYVSEFRPEAIGLSLRNVDNVAYPNVCSYLPFYQKVISHLRKITEAPIILGGSGFSLMPGAILSYLEADYGVWGEGEVTLIRLLDRLESGSPIANLPGVFSIYRLQDHKLPLSPQYVSMQDLPVPRREGFANDKYLRFGGMGNIQTKRGCPFSCVYCTYPLIEGHDVRLRPPTEVAVEMEHMCQNGIDTLFIVDSVFNFPPHHAKSVCQEIIKLGIKVRWSCYLNPSMVTESLLQIMKEAGCTSVEFGTDSGSNAILKQLGKLFTITDVQHSSELCHKVGVPFCHSLIFGAPGEDQQTMQETFDLMTRVNPTAVIAMTGIRVFPGTKLAEFASPEDLIQTGKTMLEPSFYLAKSSRHFLLDTLYAHAERNRNWILPGSNININHRIHEKLRQFGVRGPLWEYMRRRKR